ncbi:MAG TPA: acyl-CoA thioesterase domain-containing protein [Acidimicrobiales bacterium]
MLSSLPSRLDAALDALLGALELERHGDDRFRAPPDARRSLPRVYGGQLLAQALVAAAATVTGKPPHSLHATFVKAGTPGRPLDVAVDRLRDGRTMARRQVTVAEAGAPLLNAVVSFHEGGSEPDVTAPPPPTPPPEELPTLQDWAAELPPELAAHGRHWIEQPPPVEFRMGEPPSFLGPPSNDPVRSHWIRAPRALGDDPVRHAALLAYASDFLLMDMVFRAAFRDRPDAGGPGRANGLSLDHALWFHRPVRFDRWHLYTQEAPAVVGDRGLARGAIHDDAGRLVATAVQEVLVL